ncbi:DUF1456 family protein [Williamwhitmania taraxaci]|uniref:Uncharacterized protein n=1 Tax=Williamwhitmania taraxaci TaxID=1640674 RepID=A0A1G6TT81_9BACT|nr:DUF1456 family protein [Williamwhitmania taraxaci]SDD32280.1 Protein of unknown function [Williamwhitmania taraxaci]
MSNNEILKKLRVALHLRDDQIIEILKLVDFTISKTELAAFFRAEEHTNYKPLGDQILRNFLNGLVIHMRGPLAPKQKPADAPEDSKDPQ